MLIFVAVWFAVLGVWMIWHLRAQVAEIRTFTGTTPDVIEPLQPDAETIAGLRERLEAFAAAVEKGERAALDLSVADLNHLIAVQEPLSHLKEAMKVAEIDSLIRLQVAFALNGMPGERLYLNGFMTARPEVVDGTGLTLVTRSIEVPGKEVSEGFQERYIEAKHLDHLFLDELRQNERIRKVLLKVTAARTEEGRLIVEYLPAGSPESP